MTLTFKDNSDIIVYAIEKILSFAREQQYLFVANCVWWIAGIIGLDTGLATHIDTLRKRKSVILPGNCETIIQNLVPNPCAISTTPSDLTDD
jgi:hypothetical protein